MRFSLVTLALGLVSLTSAHRSLQHVGKHLKFPELKRSAAPQPQPVTPRLEERATAQQYLNNKTKSMSLAEERRLGCFD